MNRLKTKIRGARNFILGMITMAIIFSFVTSVGALSGRISAILVYDDIKVKIDGRETVLTDLEGNAVEPVMIDNMLYVPMSPMARAFGKKSVYEGGASKTIVITSPVVTADSATEGVKLSDMPVDSSNGGQLGEHKERMANSGNYVFDCLTHHQDGGFFGTVTSNRDYRLDGQYKSIKGTVFLDWDYRSTVCEGSVKLYGDGKLLYASKILTEGCEVMNFEIDLTGVKMLKIEFSTDIGGIGQHRIRIGIGDTILYKYK